MQLNLWGIKHQSNWRGPKTSMEKENNFEQM